MYSDKKITLTQLFTEKDDWEGLVAFKASALGKNVSLLKPITKPKKPKRTKPRINIFRAKHKKKVLVFPKAKTHAKKKRGRGK
jgi:hypothetical protein